MKDEHMSNVFALGGPVLGLCQILQNVGHHTFGLSSVKWLLLGPTERVQKIRVTPPG